MKTQEKPLSEIVRKVMVMSAADVEAVGKDALAKFFEARHFFSEMGVVEPLTRSASREEFLRFVRVNMNDAHFVLKRFILEKDGSLSAWMSNYNPIRSQTVAKGLLEEELPFEFHPRILRKRQKDGTEKVEVITFDVCWK